MFGKLASVILNILSVCCIAVLVWNFAHRPTAPSPAAARVGSRLELPNSKWSPTRDTVVLAISTSCQYCRASASFYRELVSLANEHKLEVLALLPESPEAARPQLAAIGIEKLAAVRQGEFGRLGITATPELFLVDATGVIKAAWVGRLGIAQEAEVYGRLGVTRPRSTGDASAGEHSEYKDFGHLVSLVSHNAVVLDTRPRDSFDLGHIEGALNIPLDEMFSRAGHELPRDGDIVVYCGGMQTKGCAAVQGDAELAGATACSVSRTLLEHLGFAKVQLISADLSIVGRSGVAVTGSSCN
jgi:hypothetical protein